MWLLMCDYLKYNRDVAQMFNFDQKNNIVLLKEHLYVSHF